MITHIYTPAVNKYVFYLYITTSHYYFNNIIVNRLQKCLINRFLTFNHYVNELKFTKINF